MANEKKPTAEELAAQILLMDAALVHSLEKTLEAMQGLLATAADMRAQLHEALRQGGREEIDGLRAENERLTAENARWLHVFNMVRNGPVTEPPALPAAVEEPTAEAETADATAADEPIEESAAPLKATW